MNDGSMMVQRNEKGQIVSGVLNPVGKRQGTRHFSTLFREAIKKIDSETGDRTDKAIVNAVLKKAKKGDLSAVDIIREEVDGALPKAEQGQAGNTFNVVVMNFDAYRRTI